MSTIIKDSMQQARTASEETYLMDWGIEQMRIFVGKRIGNSVAAKLSVKELIQCNRSFLKVSQSNLNA